ncbi:hypothetical protein M407DRAFT_16874 [Tulasnella calospora MUT 4182]|uniref:Uncharacterized protein n=1 Tax=Tulasnella calospora MUT 4182 TaxID=1051891 RepID=A0A0C3QYK3_9AGAM|nr:hypothetical protein M407DRAFT_16874 [Tulasnella calospora MUT 4182]
MLNDLLNVAPGSISDVPAEDLGELWTVFTKVKENIKDGRRLENLSWRLWYRELRSSQARHHASNASPFLDSPPTEQPSLCVDSEDTASEPEEASTDVDVSAQNLVAPPSVSSTSHTIDHDAASPVASLQQPMTSRTIRTSSRSSGTRSRRSSRPLHNSHPDPACVVVRPAIHDRSNSTPTQSSNVPYIRTRRPPSFNLGKMITDPLPELRPMISQSLSDSRSQPNPTDVVPSTTVVTVEAPSTPPATTTLPAPSLVIVQPTPRPTPPESPIVAQLNTRIASLPVPKEDKPHPTTSEQHDTVPHTTSSGPGPPASAMAPVPVDDPRKRKTFFFKESPGGDAGSASSTSTTSVAKTPAQPIEVQQAAQAVATALQVAAAAGVNKPIRAPILKKGKEPVRAAVPARPAVVRQAVGRAGKAAAHVRHHSTNVTKAGGPPARSKSTAAIVNLAAMAAATAGPSQVIRRSTSSSKLPPPSADSSAKTIVAPTSPRVASPEPLEVPAPSPAQERPRPQRERSAEKQPANREASQPARTIHTKNGRLEVTTSSDFESTDTEGDDSSWASDYSDEDEPQTGGIAKTAAVEAARQLDMFQKVPTRSYTDLAKQPKAGLLTSMFHPDPTIMPHLPMHHPFRAHNSAMNLGARPVLPSNVQAAASKSSAAVPNVAQVTVTQANIGVNTSGRPGYRLKGRPEDMEVESSDEDENDEDAVPLSKSVAQRRLEALAGRIRKPAGEPRAPQAPQQQQQAPTPPPQHRSMSRLQRLTPMAEQAEPSHQISGSQFDMIPTGSVPIALPHPYNLPPAAPPSTPRTTRREMLATELSESLRRNILWERENGMRMFKRPTSSTSRLQDRKPPVSVYGNDAYHATGW